MLHTCSSESARKASKLTYLKIANVRDTSVRYFHNHRILKDAFPTNKKVHSYYMFRPLLRLQSKQTSTEINQKYFPDAVNISFAR